MQSALQHVPEPSVLPPSRREVEPSAEELHRSWMLRRFGLLYYASGIGVLLRKLRLEDHSADHIRRAAERGPLVYVLHTRSRIDWLALNRVLNARRLPLARYTNGVRNTWFAPVFEGIGAGWRALRHRWDHGAPPDPLASGWLADEVASGATTALFLVQREWTEALGLPQQEDPVASLVEAQARCDRPIQLVPCVVAWSRGPEAARTEVGKFLLGSQDEPGPLLKLAAVAVKHPDALVQAGEAVDLRELLDRLKDEHPSRRVKAVRILLRRYLYREAHVVRGPRVRPYRWTRRLVLSSPEVQEMIRDEAAVGPKTADALSREVARMLDRIAARFSYPVVRIAAVVTRFLWNRIFSGVDWRPEDVERIRAALRAGTPILVPCHRSHLDYLLLSSQLYERDVVIPHIVAGENLSFWPLGAIFRRLGAFFIRRSFKGDRVFPVVFGRYLKQLVRDGFPVEFFIEGGRSRTGKLLPAKLGVLSMALDSAAGGREDQEVTFLPIAISYAQIAEEGAYARELAGGRKEKEDIGQVVKAGRVLGRRYGRVYVRVGEPLRARDVFAESGNPWDRMDPEHRREVVQHTGERIMFRIAQSMVVTPTGLVAMGLLAQSRRGVRIGELHERVRRFHEVLAERGAQASFPSYGGWVVEEALQRFERDKMVHRLLDEQGDILQVVDARRITLEYYKNGLIHFVAPHSLLAAAVRACRDQGPDHADVARLFRLQVFLLRYEFTLDPEVSVEDLERSAAEGLVRYGGIAPGGGAIADMARVVELAELTRNFLESYLLVLRGAVVLRSRDIPADDLPRRIQSVGEGLLAVDELARPEALSVANLQNAVRAFREEGVIEFRSGGAGLQFDEVVHGQYVDDLKRLVGLS